MNQPQLGHFGDRRLAATGNALLAAMQKQQTMCLNELAGDSKEARRFNEFFDNEAVPRHEILGHAGTITAARAAGRHVLAIADTSELNGSPLFQVNGIHALVAVCACLRAFVTVDRWAFPRPKPLWLWPRRAPPIAVPRR
jgi:hypothetical protein